MAESQSGSGLTEAVSKALAGSQSMETPDITKAQLIAVVQALVTLLVLLGATPSSEAVTLAVAGISGLVAVVLPLSDAAMRRARAKNAVHIAEAKRLLTPAPAGMLKDSLEAELERIRAASSDSDQDPKPEPEADPVPAASKAATPSP